MNIPFRLSTEFWMFKSNLGWLDYFVCADTDNDHVGPVLRVDGSWHGNVLGNFPIREYAVAIPKIYRYNATTLEKIKEAQTQLGLESDNYSSIFIRRGDKLVHETYYVNASKYLQKLLELKPEVKKVYVQTDDYNVITELREYMSTNSLNIELCTLCDENCKGIVVFSEHKRSLLENRLGLESNRDYLKTLSFKEVKPVDQMNASEIYEHTVKMIVGLEMLLRSDLCVTDYGSNVGRFLKLAAQDPQKVVSALDLEKDMPDFNKVICPAHSF